MSFVTATTNAQAARTSALAPASAPSSGSVASSSLGDSPPKSSKGLKEKKDKKKSDRATDREQVVRVHVRAGTVALCTELNAKWASKPLAKAVLEHFYPYYSRETGKKLFAVGMVEARVPTNVLCSSRHPGPRAP